MSNIGKRNLLIVLMVACAAAAPAVAQEHEIAVLVGRLTTGDKGIQSTQPVKAVFSGAGTYEVNYANRIIDGKVASLHWEIPVAAIPRTRIKSSNALLARSYSSIFITPGLKLKLFPGGGISPFVAAGLGYGRLTASDQNLNGQANTGTRGTNTWVFGYGGGVDLNLISVLALRGEIRDFIAGTPQLNAPFFNKRQHNLLVAGGVVLKW